MKTSVKHIAAAMALCILSGTCVTPLSAFADEPAKPLYGDVNCNGEVDVKDAVMLARLVGGDVNVSVSEKGKRNGDCDGSGKNEVSDLTKLLLALANLIPRDSLGKR